MFSSVCGGELEAGSRKVEEFDVCARVQDDTVKAEGHMG